MTVSIVMPTYNSADFICESIESVKNQTYEDWELIIVDDCSSDNTDEVVNKYLKYDKRIKYFKFKKNMGAGIARTEAIKYSNGKYIAFLDSDDLWCPNKLELQINYMEENNIEFSATSYELIDEAGNELNIVLIPPKKSGYTKFILLSNPVGNSTIIYNQEKLGKFEVPDIRKRNDFALWLNVLKKAGYCYGFEDVLTKYRFGRSNSLSKNKLSLLKYHWELYYNIEKLGVIKSSIATLSWIIMKGTGLSNKRMKKNIN